MQRLPSSSLDPEPQTLNFKPQTLNPIHHFNKEPFKDLTLNPNTLNPKPLDPKPQTLSPKSPAAVSG